MEKEKVLLIINSASYDRVAYALTVAGMSAALGKDVHVLFAHRGLLRLKKGALDKVGNETDAWIRDIVKAGLRKGSIRMISEYLKELKEYGGKIYACPAAMALHNITVDELIDEVDRVRGVASFLEEYSKENSALIYV